MKSQSWREIPEAHIRTSTIQFARLRPQNAYLLELRGPISSSSWTKTTTFTNSKEMITTENSIWRHS